MNISPELAAVAHAAANLATARKAAAVAHSGAVLAHAHYRTAGNVLDAAWAEYQTACDAFAASMAG